MFHNPGTRYSSFIFFLLCAFFAIGQGNELAIVDISKVTSVISDDVIDTMTRLGMLKYSDGEHHIIATPVRLDILHYGFVVCIAASSGLC